MDNKILNKKFESYKRNHSTENDFLDLERSKVKRDKGNFKKSVKKIEKTFQHISKENDDNYYEEYSEVLYETKKKRSSQKTHNNRYKELSQYDDYKK